jgi:hypothetical protein
MTTDLSTRAWAIRYVNRSSLNTTIHGTHREALEFAYGEPERPIRICHFDRNGNTVIVDEIN